MNFVWEDYKDAKSGQFFSRLLVDGEYMGAIQSVDVPYKKYIFPENSQENVLNVNELEYTTEIQTVWYPFVTNLEGAILPNGSIPWATKERAQESVEKEITRYKERGLF